MSSKQNAVSWLIERTDGPIPAYWDGRGTDTFHYDANEAVRFARREDAERVQGWMLKARCAEHCRVTEHGWFNDAPVNRAPDQLSVPDQLITIVSIARAAGYDSGAEWIERHATKTMDRIIRDLDVDTQAFYCRGCGKPRTKAQGGTTFTVCDDCWNADAEKSGRPNQLATPPSEPSRTDAVKEAIARATRHKDCELGDCHAVAGVAFGTHQYHALVRECEPARRLPPLLAALADAEQKLADERLRSKGQHDALGVCLKRAELADGKLADAEKRAKDAGEKALEEFTLRISAQRDHVKEVDAETDRADALTRKLATVTGIARSLIGALDGRMESASLGKEWLNEQRTALAAIDAPAGEGAAIPPGGKCPECGGVTYGTREVHLSDCSRELPVGVAAMTDTLAPSECAKLSEIEAKMTPGPWRVDKKNISVLGPDGIEVLDYAFDGDATGIAVLRNNFAHMLATIAELRGELALADGGRKAFARQAVELFEALATIAKQFGFDGDVDDDSFINFMKERAETIAAHEATD